MSKKKVWFYAAIVFSSIEFVALSYVNEHFYKNIIYALVFYMVIFIQPYIVNKSFDRESKILLFSLLNKKYKKIILILLLFYIGPLILFYSILPNLTYKAAYNKVETLIQTEYENSVIYYPDEDDVKYAIGTIHDYYFVGGFYYFDVINLKNGDLYEIIVNPVSGKVVKLKN
ncbi:hypothetical protein [Bacillus sp. SM2101]|uniref:hypothetical protein n=1 Tax=Bacillus sp. SM2101 TaxID=2805366 RepID=UPI001BDEBC0F|nr:hypothetical protein [Bacillus sp. SM2101]